MDRALQLTFSLLLTLVIKLPIIAFCFKKRKRQSALSIAFVINLITWIAGTIIWLKLAETADLTADGKKGFDVNHLYIRIGICIVETIIYWFFLGRSWTKAILMSVISNLVMYFAAQYITLPEDFFQKKNNMIR